MTNFVKPRLNCDLDFAPRDRSHKRPRHLLGLPNWTFPLFFYVLLEATTPSLLHINPHFYETAYCANGYFGLKMLNIYSLPMSISDIKKI